MSNKNIVLILIIAGILLLAVGFIVCVCSINTHPDAEQYQSEANTWIAVMNFCTSEETRTVNYGNGTTSTAYNFVPSLTNFCRDLESDQQLINNTVPPVGYEKAHQDLLSENMNLLMCYQTRIDALQTNNASGIVLSNQYHQKAMQARNALNRDIP